MELKVDKILTALQEQDVAVDSFRGIDRVEDTTEDGIPFNMQGKNPLYVAELVYDSDEEPDADSYCEMILEMMGYKSAFEYWQQWSSDHYAQHARVYFTPIV